MLRIGQSAFPEPDKFSLPQTELDFALKEVQDGVSFSEASFFIGAGEMVFNGLTQGHLDILLGIQENFIPVRITHLEMDYDGVAIIRVEYSQIREFQDFYKTTVTFQEVEQTEVNTRRLYKIAFVTPTRTVIQPIERFDIVRQLGGSASCNVVLDSVSGEFDPDNPNAELWVSTEGNGKIELMKYRVAEGGVHTYTGTLSLMQGLIDHIDPSGYFGAGKDRVTFRLSDRMNHMPYIKMVSEVYTDTSSRVILTAILNEAGIGGTFSGGINVPEIQFVDTSYQNAINMLLQAEFAAGCIDGNGNFRIFSLATDQVHHTIPQLLIEDIRPSYGTNNPVTAVRVAIQPKDGSYEEGTEENVYWLTAIFNGVLKFNVPYPLIDEEDPSKGRKIMTSPRIEPRSNQGGVVNMSIVNRGDNADVLVTGLTSGATLSADFYAKEVIEGEAGFEVIYHDAALEELYGGRLEKKITNYAVQNETAGLDLARNYLTLENWKRITYSVKLAGFMDLYAGQTVKFKHIKFGHDVHILLEEVKHEWKADDTLKTSFKGWKVGDFYV